MSSNNGYREFLNRKTGRRIRVGYVENLAICLNILCFDWMLTDVPKLLTKIEELEAALTKAQDCSQKNGQYEEYA